MSDTVTMTEAKLMTHEDWTTYCNNLRNVTEQSGFPWEVEWPTQPE